MSVVGLHPLITAVFKTEECNLISPLLIICKQLFINVCFFFCMVVV